MESLVIVVIVLASTLTVIIIGIILYFQRNKMRNTFSRLFKRRKKVHQITVPARISSGENEIVLAVTQRRENVSRNGSAPLKVNSFITASAIAPSVNEEITQTRSHHEQPPVTRDHSFVASPHIRRATFISGSDVPSPIVSIGSLQSLLMSSQVAIFNSSTERLSLSSQNQIPSQQQQVLRHYQSRISGVGEGVAPPFTISPAVSVSCVHLSQPSYFDEPPPSYQESMLMRKLRASDRSTGNRGLNQNLHTQYNNDVNTSTASRFSNCRRSCRT